MVSIEMNFRSHALNMNVPVNVLLPEVGTAGPLGGAPAGAFKTLYLLHGLAGNHCDWLRKTAIERYANKHGIAVVMPCVARTWYTDTAYDANYFTFITEELPHICRSYFKGMCDCREYNYIAGNSMGGYGAIKAAMTYPDRYCGCAALSGALDITRKNRTYNLKEWQSIFGFDLDSALALDGTKHDIFHMAKEAKASGTALPRLFLSCGTEDSLIGVNRDYHALLNSLDIAHGYEEHSGAHTWEYWDNHIKVALEFLFSE